MQNRIKHINCTVLAFLLIFVALYTPALGGADYTPAVEVSNRAFVNSQLSDSESLYSMTLPEPEANIDSDNADIRNKAIEITEDCSTDLSKVHAIHDWVAANTYYDMDYFNNITSSTPVKASDVLEYGYTVCQGYANLSTALLRSIGIPAKIVSGYALGLGTESEWTQELVIGARRTEENHAWNEAYVDGRWVIFDATWDSTNTAEGGYKIPGTGLLQKYFDLTPEQFAADHKITGIDENHRFINRIHNIAFRVENNQIQVRGAYDETRTTLIIPSYISGKPVTSITAEAFLDYSALTRLVLPDTLTSVGRLAFLGCSNLLSVTLPENIISVGEGAFGYIYDYFDGTYYKNVQRMNNFTFYCYPGTAAHSYAMNFTIYAGSLVTVNRNTASNADYGIKVTTLTTLDTLPTFFVTQLEAESYAAFSADFPGKLIKAYDIPVSAYGKKLPGSTVTVAFALPQGALPNTAKVYGDVGGKIIELHTVENEGVITVTGEGIERYYLVYSGFIPGDLDGDKNITTTDARITLRAAAKLETLTAIQLAAAEVDGVEGITTTDARILLRVAAKLQTLE